VLPNCCTSRHADFIARWPETLCLVPPSARWRQPFPYPGPYATAFVSGWMLLPDGPRKRRVDRGFALSDHADYDEIHRTIHATGAERVGANHQAREQIGDGLAAQSPLGEPRLRDQRDQRGHRETELTLLGFIGLIDPPRAEAAAAVSADRRRSRRGASASRIARLKRRSRNTRSATAKRLVQRFSTC